MNSQEELDRIMEKAMTMKSRFRFQCSHCGICCQTISEIFLSPFDLYTLSKQKDMIINEFIENHCYFGDESEAGSPWPRLYLNNDNGVCTFYQGRCGVYAARPFMCRLYPIGYVYSALENTEDYIQKEETIGRCIGEGRSYKLKEWLKAHEESREYSWNWFQVHVKLYRIERSLVAKDISKVAFRIITLLERIYFDYNITLEFKEQYEGHRKTLFDYLDSLGTRMCQNIQ